MAVKCSPQDRKSLSKMGFDSALGNVSYFDCQPLFFNQRFFRNQLTQAPAIKVFKDAIAGVNTHFDQRFLMGADIRHLVEERSAFFDLVLHYAWHQFSWPSAISLLAVGGYGRGELHPFSDIDILILLRDEPSSATQEQLQKLITFLCCLLYTSDAADD